MRPPPALDFPELLKLLAGRGDQPALTFYAGRTPAGRLTYRELCERAERLAETLRAEHGVTRGDRVAILAPNRLEVPALLLALFRLGAAAVPLNPAATAEDWGYILRHSRARGLCATQDLAERAAPVADSLFKLPLETLFKKQPVEPASPPEPPPAMLSEALADAPAVVLYTSGTTGNPKGVVLRQRNLIANAWSMAQNFGLDATTQLAVLPLYHAHAFGFGLMTALSTGGHLIFTERLDPFTWAAVIRDEQVSVTSVVPTMLPMLLAAGVKASKVPSLRHVMVSSAPLASTLARDFETRTGLRLVQGWGLSEYTNFACCMDPGLPDEEHAQRMGSEAVPSVGAALPGTEVRVVAEGVPVTEGQRGELQVRGHSTMLGYLDDPGATATVLDSQGWLSTGDEGFFRFPGRFPGQLTSGRGASAQAIYFITGRLKELIIRDAEKYSPLRLERSITDAVPELAGLLAVVGFAHADHGEEVGAYLQLEELGEDLQRRLSTAVQAMPIAERPKVILYGADPIPRTHTGKVQRRKLQPWFEAWHNHRGALVVAKR